MKHAGEILKAHIEKAGLKKRDIAESAGISYNYLSTIFKQATMDAALLEKLYVAAGMHPAVVFDVPDSMSKLFSDNVAKTLLGNAKVEIVNGENLRELLAEKDRLIAEKERTIQILLGAQNISVPGQNRDNNDK